MRLIDADALKEKAKMIDWLCNKQVVSVEDINNAPTVEQKYYERIVAQINPVIEARPQGEWIPEENTFTDLNGIIETYTRFKCSVCNQGQNFGEYPFCCWCGAKMEGIKS